MILTDRLYLQLYDYFTVLFFWSVFCCNFLILADLSALKMINVSDLLLKQCLLQSSPE